MDQAPVVQTLDSAIHRINHFPAESVIDFRNTYPLDRDLSGGERYPTFDNRGQTGKIASHVTYLLPCNRGKSPEFSPAM